MGKLDKYARVSKEKRTERIQTKLTPTEYRLYMKYLQARGLSQAEGTRYLILEEIGLGIPDDIFGETAATIEVVQNETIETPKETPKKSTNGVQKEAEKESDDKPKYTQWRINEKMPCPICRKWVTNIAAHLKGKHPKTTKQKVFSDPKYVEIANQMVKAVLGES